MSVAFKIGRRRNDEIFPLLQRISQSVHKTRLLDLFGLELHAFEASPSLILYDGSLYQNVSKSESLSASKTRTKSAIAG